MPPPNDPRDAWRLILANDLISELEERIEEVPRLAQTGYRQELAALKALVSNSNQFVRVVLALDSVRKERLNAAVPVELGRGLARKMFYTGCVSIHRARMSPPHELA